MNFQDVSPSQPRRSERISAFFTCYNDEYTIAEMVRAADETLAGVTDDYEIIVVNDGSGDGSAGVLEELAKSVPALRVMTHAQNRGYGGALQSGFKAATGDLVFYTDGDGQYDPRELMLLLEAMEDGVDVVNGYKTVRSDSVVRRVLGGIYNYCAKRLLGIPMRDLDCDFRLFRGEVARQLRLTNRGGIVCAQMMQQVYRGGYRVKEVPVSHLPRRFGASQFFRPVNVLSLGFDLVRLWWSRLFEDRTVREDVGAEGRAREAKADAVAEADGVAD